MITIIHYDCDYCLWCFANLSFSRLLRAYTHLCHAMRLDMVFWQVEFVTIPSMYYSLRKFIIYDYYSLWLLLFTRIVLIIHDALRICILVCGWDQRSSFHCQLWGICRFWHVEFVTIPSIHHKNSLSMIIAIHIYCFYSFRMLCLCAP